MPRHKMTKKRRVSGTTVGRKPRRARSRSRRVSGTSNIGGVLTRAGGLIVGAVAARELNTIIVKMFPGFSPLMSGVLQAGVGFFLPKIVRNNFVDDMGMGMIANGGMVAIVATGVISGPNNDRMTYRLNGSDGFKAIAGPGNRLGAFSVTAGTNPISSRPQRQVVATKHVY